MTYRRLCTEAEQGTEREMRDDERRSNEHGELQEVA